MAKRILVELIDDLDGTEAKDSVTFGLDGVQYTIDLSDKNDKALREYLAPFIQAGSKVGRVPSQRPAPPYRLGSSQSMHEAARQRTQEENRAIRKWAAMAGYQVSERGAIKFEIVKAYNDAMEAQRNRAAVKANGSVVGDGSNGLFLAASDAPALSASGILKNMEPKKAAPAKTTPAKAAASAKTVRTELPADAKTRKRATTNNVVEQAPPPRKRAARKSTTA